RFENKEPSPAADTEPANVIQNQARSRRAYDIGDGDCGHEQGNRLSLFTLPEPVGEIQDNPRKEAGFSDPQQESQYVNLSHVLRQAGQQGNSSPADQYPGNPNPWSNLVQQYVARYLKEKIAPEKDAAQQPELLAGDGQIIVHG